MFFYARILFFVFFLSCATKEIDLKPKIRYLKADKDYAAIYNLYQTYKKLSEFGASDTKNQIINFITAVDVRKSRWILEEIFLDFRQKHTNGRRPIPYNGNLIRRLKFMGSKVGGVDKFFTYRAKNDMSKPLTRREYNKHRKKFIRYNKYHIRFLLNPDSFENVLSVFSRLIADDDKKNDKSFIEILKYLTYIKKSFNVKLFVSIKPLLINSKKVWVWVYLIHSLLDTKEKEAIDILIETMNDKTILTAETGISIAINSLFPKEVVFLLQKQTGQKIGYKYLAWKKWWQKARKTWPY